MQEETANAAGLEDSLNARQPDQLPDDGGHDTGEVNENNAV